MRQRFGEEFTQRGLGFVDAQAVQVADRFDAVFTPLELSHHAVLHAFAPEGNLVSGIGEPGARILQAFHQHQRAIRRGEARPRGRFTARTGHPRAMRDGLHVAHCLAKQLRVEIRAFAAQATSVLTH